MPGQRGILRQVRPKKPAMPRDVRLALRRVRLDSWRLEPAGVQPRKGGAHRLELVWERRRQVDVLAGVVAHVEEAATGAAVEGLLRGVVGRSATNRSRFQL